MKYRYLSILFFTFVVLSGCSGEKESKKISLLNADMQPIHSKSVTHVTDEKSEERKNRVALSRIEADTKIKIAKIQNEGQLNIAKVNAKTEQEVIKAKSATKITTSKLDASTKKETMQYSVYIALAVILFLIVALFVLFLNSKKNRELQKELQEEKLRHDKALHEKELEEKRLHKVLDLIADGKIPSSIEEEVLLAISKPKNQLINPS